MATTDQIAEIRGFSGDLDSNDYVVSDAQIGAWYDATGSICGTAYKVMQWRLAKVSNDVGARGDGLAPSPKVQQIKSAMEMLRQDCGDALPVAGQGYMNLGIDEEISTVNIE